MLSCPHIKYKHRSGETGTLKCSAAAVSEWYSGSGGGGGGNTVVAAVATDNGQRTVSAVTFHFQMCVSCGGRGGSARSPHVLHAAGRARGALPAAADGAALLPRGQL